MLLIILMEAFCSTDLASTTFSLLATSRSETMQRHFTSSSATCRSYSLVLSIVLCLRNQPAESLPQSILMGLNAGYHSAICDEEYRAKYFNDERHREAILAGVLFEPSKTRPEDGQSFATNLSNEDKYIDHSFTANEDKDSFEIDYDDESPYFINYENSEFPILVRDKNSPSLNRYPKKVLHFFKNRDQNNKLSEFMDEENPHSKLFYKIKRLSRPTGRNFSELYKFKRKLKSRGRSSLKKRESRNRKRNMVARRRATRSAAGGRFFDRRIRSRKSERHDMRRNSFNDDNRRFYTMMDTFRPMFNGRRGGKNVLRGNISKAEWTQDNCKSLRRIIGGSTVQTAEMFPYMVFVDTGCGGGIISDKWVLTAGHCFEREALYVHVGGIKIMSGCQYHIVHVFVHPRYSRLSLEFDIALLEIYPPFVFSPAIRPISMSSVKARRKSCGVVAGWGAQQYQAPHSMTLSMTTIPIIAKQKCRRFALKESQFCAGYDDGSRDTCQGDSGGPFVVGGVLVGIISYGFKCARPNTPGVYVDVSYHRDWIRSITGF